MYYKIKCKHKYAFPSIHPYYIKKDMPLLVWSSVRGKHHSYDNTQFAFLMSLSCHCHIRKRNEIPQDGGKGEHL